MGKMTYQEFKTMGTGSLIDADMLDGLHADVFSKASNIYNGSGPFSIKEGTNNISSGQGTHAEGYQTTASGDYSHSEGYQTNASGVYAHAEGYHTIAKTIYAHAEGSNVVAINGTAYKITTFDNTLKTITLDKVTGLIVGDLLNINIINSNPIEDIPIIAINGLVVSLNTIINITSLWIVAVKVLNSMCTVHAEGGNTTASGNYSHAEGGNTIANGPYSHSEGSNTVANNHSSHAEGSNTSANGSSSHAEGNATAANALYSHSEGNGTIVNGPYSHAEGDTTDANGIASHSEGFRTMAKTDYSHVEGRYSLAVHGVAYKITTFDNTLKTITLDKVTGLIVGDLLTIKRVDNKTLEDILITAINGLIITVNTINIIYPDWKYAIKTIIPAYPVHAEGHDTLASGSSSHAEGYSTVAIGYGSHTEGGNTTASGYFSHAEGGNTKASGDYSRAEGYNTVASGYYSHASGLYNQSKYAQTVIGQYGTISNAEDLLYSSTTEAFIIGNGTGTGVRGNAFKVMFDGKTYADGAYASTGADYSEYFEWLDGNLNNEDRVGYFVTLDGEKIRKANVTDDYIIGIVSATPSIVGDNYESWNDKYIKDIFGRIKYHEVSFPETYKIIHHEAIYNEIIIDEVLDKQGNIITPYYVDKILLKDAYDEQVLEYKAHIDIVPMLNPLWDPSQEYISRENRKEWSAIGMMGKLLVYDDGSCQINGYCKPNNDGIAISSVNGYKVINRISSNIIKIILK